MEITKAVSTICYKCFHVAWFATNEGLFVCGGCAEFEKDCTCDPDIKEGN